MISLGVFFSRSSLSPRSFSSFPDVLMPPSLASKILKILPSCVVLAFFCCSSSIEIALIFELCASVSSVRPLRLRAASVMAIVDLERHSMLSSIFRISSRALSTSVICWTYSISASSSLFEVGSSGMSSMILSIAFITALFDATIFLTKSSNAGSTWVSIIAVTHSSKDASLFREFLRRHFLLLNVVNISWRLAGPITLAAPVIAMAVRCPRRRTCARRRAAGLVVGLRSITVYLGSACLLDS